MHILLLEDDKKAARLLAQGLQEEGFSVDVAHTAEQAASQIGPGYDLAIFDWMLPGMDGTEFCRQLRREGVDLPILMLTARDAVADRVEGLNTGADDYLTKPFAFEELLARVHALLRRPRGMPATRLQIADLDIDLVTHQVKRGDTRLDLTQKEYAVLVLLVRNAGQVVSRQQLAQHVWHADLIAIDNLMDVHIKNLRRKIDMDGRAPIIETVRGQGFRFIQEKSD
ncbi:response regulator transcription factor [Herbaspirillum chlorophenolicum]|jgi:DNA-binding response OmpR family regulator|uniref:Response regulator transcription factor n=1 Tax=Herbaspirillum chlorophenolicum TaxID=211589 RepID=A0ABW8EZG7_9BURK|nr:response regulator transcription factor [Herbaspirillum chlorophenolicum]